MSRPIVNANDGSDLLGFEEDLWDAANKLRGNIDAAEYKHYVLPLIFLKYISDAFEDRRKQIIAEGRDPTQKIRYSSELVFWVPEEALWNNIAKKARSPSIDHDLDSAMEAIERENPELTGVLKKDFSTSDLSTRVLGELVDLFSNISISFADEDARSKDVIGRVYEYFLHKFAGAEKRGGGEFYTPRSVVNLLVHALSPHSGSIYDGCFGSAGMFVQSEEFLRVRQASLDSMVYGQESNPTTWKLGKMNLVIRGIEADLGEGPEDTLYRDWHEGKLFDFCMVNPPFNIKEWGNDLRPERWDYGVPPDSNANFAWIQHYLQHLLPSGFAGIVMSNGSLSASGVQGKIRKSIIDDHKLDCVITLPDRLFHSTGIAACIWILSNNKSDHRYRDRRGETLFIDCRGMGKMVSRRQRELSQEDIDRVATTYQNWRSEDFYDAYEDERGFCKSATTEEIAEHEYIVVPGRYVGAPPLPDDGEPFQEKMSRLTAELGEHFDESRRLEDEIRKNLGDLGFDF